MRGSSVASHAHGDDPIRAAAGGCIFIIIILVVDGDERRARELERGLSMDSERAVTEISRRVRVHAKDDGRHARRDETRRAARSEETTRRTRDARPSLRIDGCARALR